MYLGAVYPGDHMAVEIAHVGTSSWTIAVEDLTQQTVWAGAVSYTAPGTAAEWVEEAPTGALGLDTLADYGSVNFYDLGVGGPGTTAATVTPVYMVTKKARHVISYPGEYDTASNSFIITYGTPLSTTSPFPAVPVATGTSGAPAPLPAPPTMPLSTPTSPGYWLSAVDGGVFSFGSAKFHGSPVSLWPANEQGLSIVTGIAPTPDGGGYWLSTVFGGVFPFGDAKYEGALVSMDDLAETLGIVPTHDGKGYLMVSATGGVYAFGDAHFYGSCGTVGSHCGPGQITALLPDTSGHGYWLLTSTCKMVPFGDAPNITDADCQTFASASRVAARSVALTPDGQGFWVLLVNGRVFPEGDAKTMSSWTSNVSATATDPAEVLLPTTDGKGAWLVQAHGEVTSLGDATSLGDVSNTKLNAQIFAAASSG
jgi:hypothetical protein